ncbi:MAG: glycine--tRNA ligase [Bacteroidales bacterium]
MTKQADFFKKIISHCKEYGFIFPSSEIYDGLGAVYDYGPLGVELKRNIKDYWWDTMMSESCIVGIDSAIFMHPTVWKASGHVDAFNDPLIDNKDSKKRYRADILIEEHLATLKKGKKRDALHARFVKALNASDLKALRQIIIDEKIVCPVSGTCNWTEIRQFNLMFSTEMGSTADNSQKVYLRPETAQGIFVNFLNVQKTSRMKVPFGIAQIGKAFRNEIVARQFLFRMREFEQMEMQFFVPPRDAMKWFDYWKEARMQWHKKMGLGDEKYRFHDHDKPAHYADAATDIEFEMPFGFSEVEGIHSRTDFDLKQHEKYSGKKLQYYDPSLKQSYTPYVIETSAGLDRIFLSLIASSYTEETLENGDKRVVLKLPHSLAPFKAAILPLVKKDGLPERAQEIKKHLDFFDQRVLYDDKDSIGKRYRRQDAIGTPYCITVDYETLKGNPEKMFVNEVTIRNRDTMKQERLPVESVESFLSWIGRWEDFWDKISY